MAEEEKKSRKGVSRRDFIKGTGLVVGGVAISSTVLGVACNPKEIIKEVPGQTVIKEVPGQTVVKEVPGQTVVKEVPGQTVIKAPEGVVTLTVNNQKYVLAVQPEWSLAFVLREKLGLVGLKVGCDRGECGTCSIVVDGRQHLACAMMAIESEGINIVTIEGLTNGPNLHPVQKLFLENNAFQCGYCTPGMIMSSVALLDKTPKPTLNQVQEALSGNLCYCGDYTRIVNTVLKGL